MAWPHTWQSTLHLPILINSFNTHIRLALLSRQWPSHIGRGQMTYPTIYRSTHTSDQPPYNLERQPTNSNLCLSQGSNDSSTLVISLGNLTAQPGVRYCHLKVYPFILTTSYVHAKTGPNILAWWPCLLRFLHVTIIIIVMRKFDHNVLPEPLYKPTGMPCIG